jgi:lysophospholipase L1-like esterase
VSLSKKLLFSFITVTLFFAAAEGTARLLLPPPDFQRHREHEQIFQTLGLPAMNDTMVSDPRLFWTLKPGLEGKVIEGHIRDAAIRFTFSTNSRGLRGPEVPRRKGAFRILALGDSTTFGLGVNDDETWPAVLESLLREKTGRPVEVINAGVPGYTAFQGLRYLEDRGLSLAPDLVLATFGFNDADSWSARSDYQTAWLLAIRRWERPLLYSRLYAGLKGLYRREEPQSPPESRRPRLSGREFDFALSQIRELCSSRRIPLVLVIWPYAGQKSSGSGELVIYQPLVASFGAAHVVPVVNLVDSFAAAGGPLFFDHVHANSAGCRVAAEALSPACLAWMDRRKRP